MDFKQRFKGRTQKVEKGGIHNTLLYTSDSQGIKIPDIPRPQSDRPPIYMMPKPTFDIHSSRLKTEERAQNVPETNYSVKSDMLYTPIYRKQNNSINEFNIKRMNYEQDYTNPQSGNMYFEELPTPLSSKSIPLMIHQQRINSKPLLKQHLLQNDQQQQQLVGSKSILQRAGQENSGKGGGQENNINNLEKKGSSNSVVNPQRKSKNILRKQNSAICISNQDPNTDYYYGKGIKPKKFDQKQQKQSQPSLEEQKNGNFQPEFFSIQAQNRVAKNGDKKYVPLTDNQQQSSEQVLKRKNFGKKALNKSISNNIMVDMATSEEDENEQRHTKSVQNSKNQQKQILQIQKSRVQQELNQIQKQQQTPQQHQQDQQSYIAKITEQYYQDLKEIQSKKEYFNGNKKYQGVSSRAQTNPNSQQDQKRNSLVLSTNQSIISTQGSSPSPGNSTNKDGGGFQYPGHLDDRNMLRKYQMPIHKTIDLDSLKKQNGANYFQDQIQQLGSYPMIDFSKSMGGYVNNSNNNKKQGFRASDLDDNYSLIHRNAQNILETQKQQNTN